MTRFRTRLGLIAATIATMAIVLGTAGAAQAENVNYTLDRGVIKLSDTWAKIVDPDLTPPDLPAKLSADVAPDGTLNAPKEAFTFPNKTITNLATGNPLLPNVDAKIAIEANAAITGNLDLTTGVSSVDIPVKATITVYSAGSPSSVARCGVSGFSLGLSTTGQLNDPGDPSADPPRPPAIYDATPFINLPGTDGAMIATWPGLPNSVAEGGSLAGIVCPAVDGLIGGPGGIWLDGKAEPGVIPPPIVAPEKAPTITSGPSGTVDSKTADFAFAKAADEPQPVTGFECSIDDGAFSACDEGTKSYGGLRSGSHTFKVKAVNEKGASAQVASRTWTVKGDDTKPTCATDRTLCKARLTIKATPRNKQIKRGKKAVFTVKVRNAGNGPAKGMRICLAAPKKLVGGAKCVRGALAAGKTKTVRFRVTVKKKAKRGKKVTLKFTATANKVAKKTASAKVKVK